MKQYALITGARQGLGKGFAIELSKMKINTILVSRPNHGLQNFCKELKETYQVDSIAYETDLTVYQNVIDLAHWINEQFDIFILINNVGKGGSSKITDVDIEYINHMLKLNVVAATVLTHQLLPNLLRQPQGYILNVASLAAFLPIGFKTIYPATKSFIYSFSRSLRRELKNSNVSVSVVSPGPIRTNDDIIKRTEKGYFGKFIVWEPEDLAKECIKQLFKKKGEIVVNPFVRFLIRVLPMSLKTDLMTKIVLKELK